MPRSEPIRPWVIGHRGASGLCPEHSLRAYTIAINQGADFIEPDLVMTADGVLVARHDVELSSTTDVADHPEFARRLTTKIVEGRTLSGWFVEDFTLAELRTLKLRERLPELRPQSAAYNDRFGIATLEEILDLVRERTVTLNRRIGIVAELKHPSYFEQLDLGMEVPLLTSFERHGFWSSDDPAMIECFEVGVLERIRPHTGLRLVQALEAHGSPSDRRNRSYAQMATAEGLAAIADYADGIAPSKALIVPRGGDGRSGAPTSLVADAHAAGLFVLAWTFRSENLFLPAELRRGEVLDAHGLAGAEIMDFCELGVDGLFCDYPEVAVQTRLLKRSPSPDSGSSS